jgi:hypothetical protein
LGQIYPIDYVKTEDEFATLGNVYPGQLFALQGDVTKEARIAAAVDKIIEEAGVKKGMKSSRVRRGLGRVHVNLADNYARA